MCICLVALPIEIHVHMYYNSFCKARVQPFQKGSEDMDEMNTTMALLRAVLELIAKCETLEELRESVKRIMGE